MRIASPTRAFRREQPDRKTALMLILVVVGLAALYIGWRIPHGSSGAFRTGDRLLLLCGIAAAGGSVMAAYKAACTRGGWLLIALGSFVWAIAQLFRAEASEPGMLVYTGLYLLTSICLVYGCVVLAGMGRGPGGYRLLLTDLFPPFIAVITLVWLADIGPFIKRFDLPRYVEVAAVAHGVSAVALIVVGLIGISSWRSLQVHPAVRSLMAGMALVALADGFWLQRWFDRNSSFGTAADVAFCIGFVTITVAALQTRLLALWQSSLPTPDPVYARRLTRHSAPFALLILLALIGGQATFGEMTDRGIAICAYSGLVVVVFAMMWENLVTEREAVLADEIDLLSERIDGLISQVGRDPLTGLLNRRAFQERLDHDILVGRGTGSSVAVALIDVDNFKQVNDSLGHAVGDQVLQAVASILIGVARSSDVVARYAGDEFVMIFPGITEDAAGLVCHRMVESVRLINEQLSPIGGIRVTLSIGVAFTDKCKRNASQLVAIADAAMYDAKESGKDRVVVVNADTLTAAAYWGAEATHAAAVEHQARSDRRTATGWLRNAG
jgi:diguanylate cyclase (GGDEF)-like protein